MKLDNLSVQLTWLTWEKRVSICKALTGLGTYWALCKCDLVLSQDQKLATAPSAKAPSEPVAPTSHQGRHSKEDRKQTLHLQSLKISPHKLFINYKGKRCNFTVSRPGGKRTSAILGTFKIGASRSNTPRRSQHRLRSVPAKNTTWM